MVEDRGWDNSVGGGEIEHKKVGTNSGSIIWYNYYMYLCGIGKRKGATEDRAKASDLKTEQELCGMGVKRGRRKVTQSKWEMDLSQK